MDSTNHAFFAPCPRGLEAVLADELTDLGAADVKPTAGGVAFHGPLALCYRVNLQSRIASRLLLRIAEGSYRDEHDVYDSANAIRWQDWFTPQQRIKVKVSAHHCPLKSLDFVTLRVKDAVCDRFQFARGKRPTVDTHAPDILIAVYLDASTCTFYLDTSGEPLFKRGWRKSAGEAPIRETTAGAAVNAQKHWISMREQTHPAFAGDILWRLALPTNAKPPGLDGLRAIEWGGALRWYAGEASEIRDAVRGAAARAGGHAVLYRAPESLRCLEGAFAPLSPALLALHRRLKKSFDPKGILNPGRLYAEF